MKCSFDNLFDFDIVGFDMDGTLYNEIDFISQVYEPISNFLSEACHVNQIEVYEWMILRWKEKGSAYPFIFEEVLKKYAPDLTKTLIINHCLHIFRSFKPSLKIDQRVVSTLNRIKKRKDLFLITDGNSVLQREKFLALNLEKWFSSDNVIFTGDYGEKYAKPNTVLLNKIKILTEDKKIIYVGDRVIDRIFAQRAQFNFVQVNDFDRFWGDKNEQT